MSASQHPINAASRINLGHPVLKDGELRHVAEQLALVEQWLGLTLNPLLSVEVRGQLLHTAFMTAAYLAAYTQSWIAEHE